MDRIYSAIKKRSCLVVCHPDANRPNGVAERIGEWISARRPIIRQVVVPADLLVGVAVGNEELTAQAIAELLDIEVPPGMRFGIGDLASHEDTDACVLHIDARSMPEGLVATWLTFLTAMAGVSKELPPSERLTVVLHVVAASALEIPARDTNLNVVWWWGALSPLDVSVIVDEAGRTTLDRLTIVEVARWDVVLADQLSRGWDGDPSSLDTHLAAGACEESVDRRGVATSTPGDCISAWAAGSVESWNGQLDWHVSRLGPAGRRRRVWHAQVRGVYPWLEELRSEIVERVLPLAEQNGVGSEAKESISSAELGPLRHLVLSDLQLPVGHQVKALLDRAVSIRNSIAHLDVVSKVKIDAIHDAASAAKFVDGPGRLQRRG